MFKRSISLVALVAMSTSAAFAQEASMDALVAAAKEEGQLTTIALPHDWCNYGEVISGFKAKYGLAVNELNPDAGSADEIEAVKANKGNTGPQAPDVLDVGLSFGPAAQAEGLVQPYKVATWDEIPDDAKDADGHWYGDYYGVLSFEINKDIVETVPTDWEDLLKPDYANSVALAGNPEVEVVVPKTGVVAGVYVQAISAFAPHPNAAKLWMEYLYSDEGQLAWLKGYCHPIRFNALAEAGKIPQEMLDRLPPAEAYNTAKFPSVAEQDEAKAVITAKWDEVVGANVQ